MISSGYPEKLNNCKDLGDIFELVKSVVFKVLKGRRPGISLGLADLGEGRSSLRFDPTGIETPSGRRS